MGEKKVKRITCPPSSHQHPFRPEISPHLLFSTPLSWTPPPSSLQHHSYPEISLQPSHQHPSILGSPLPSSLQHPFYLEVSPLRLQPITSHPSTTALAGGAATGGHSLSSHPALPSQRLLSHSDHIFHQSEATGEGRPTAQAKQHLRPHPLPLLVSGQKMLPGEPSQSNTGMCWLETFYTEAPSTWILHCWSPISYTQLPSYVATMMTLAWGAYRGLEATDQWMSNRVGGTG